MKIKELKRTVNVSWSPAEHYPVLLAAGSAAQQVDASFSSNSTLDIYSLNLDDPGLDLEQKSSLQTQHKFQKLVWSGAGTIVGGCDGGILEFYSADKLLNNDSNSLVGSCTKHNGNVTALDVNPFQNNLLASGAADSEIFIWDLNNTSAPMAPGNKSQPLGNVQDVAWNRQVQHILGSTFADRCVVWDLRKNEPIMKLSDSQSRTRWRALAWHPGVATQLVVASEDDQAPLIQLWDLRLAASPLSTLQGHTAGVLALSWCSQDADLLLSAGKDGSLKCWNPNSTQPGSSYLAEICSSSGWVHSAAWSPRVPALLVSGSLHHHLAVHSLLTVATDQPSSQSAHNIMESFGGADRFSQLPAVPPCPPGGAPQAPRPAPPCLPPRPPSWLRRPCRATLQFGGKLVMFTKCPQQEGATQRLVYISQVVSEPEIVEKSTELDTVLNSALSQDPASRDILAEYCRSRGDASSDQTERYTWFMLRANFLDNYRVELLNLLGFKHDDIPSKFKSSSSVSGDHQLANHVETITSGVAGLSRTESTETDAEISTDTSTDLSDAHTQIERKLVNVDNIPPLKNVLIPNGDDNTSMICRALICGNLEEAVELCLEAKRIADALVIASLCGPSMLALVQKYHLSGSSSDGVSVLCATLVRHSCSPLLAASSTSWRATLAHALSHAHLPHADLFCEQLGDKLSQESDPALNAAASICYLCAMSVDQLIAHWTREKCDSVTSLAELTERAVIARRAAYERGTLLQNGGKLESVLNEYASRLAAQGCLQSALNMLEGTSCSDLKERLRHALGQVQNRRSSVVPQSNGRAHRRPQGHAPLADPNLYSTVQAPYEPNPWSAASVAPPPVYNPAVAAYNVPQAAYSSPQAAYSSPQAAYNSPQPLQPPPQAAQPPRPASVGSQPGGITSRSKYKVDPSVQAAPSYNQYSFTNTPLPAGSYEQPPPPAGSYEQPPPAAASCNMNGGYYSPAAAPLPAAAPPPAPDSKPPAPGWNDPPMLTTKPKPKQELQAQAPITHPLFGVEPPQHIPLHPAAYPGQPQHFPEQTHQYPGQQQQFPGQSQQFPGPPQQYPGQPQQFPGHPQQYPGQPQQFPGQPQQFPGQQAQQQGYGQPYPAPGGYQQKEVPAAVPEPEPVALQKEPVPEEHRVLQTVLDDIHTECLAKAANPQMKRKLEDVQKKLETLYDLLREYRLSEAALGSLHTCAEYARAGSYENALSVATSLATGTDFATVASFLPALKTLLQLAAQSQLYVR